MRSLCVDVDRLSYPFAEYLQAKQRLANAVYYLQKVQYGLYGTNYQLSMNAAGLMNDAQRISNSLEALNRYVVQSANEYRSLEMRLTKTAKSIAGTQHADGGKEIIDHVTKGFQLFKTTFASKNDKANDLTYRVSKGFQLWKEQFSSLKSANVGKGETAKQTEWSFGFFDNYVETSTQGLRNRSLISLLYEGVKYQAEGALHLAKGSVTKRFNENHYISAEAGIGNAEASGSVKGVLFDSKGFHPSIKAEGEAIVSAVQAKATSVFKNDILKNTFKASVDVGVVEASGKAVISKDEFTLKGEVGASAAKAKAENTFEIWGYKITVGASTEVGLGAGGGWSATSNSVEFGASLALLFGLGTNFKIEW